MESSQNGGARGATDQSLAVPSGLLPDNVFRPVVKCMIEATGLVQANIDSYNRLIEEDLETILENRMPIVTKILMPENSQYHTLRVEKHLLKPQVSPPTHRDTGEVMLPITSFNDKHNYSSDILVQHRNVIYGIGAKGEVKLYDSHDGDSPAKAEPRRFTRLPTMLRSSACYTHRQDPATLRRLSEDPYDHGGYFIIDSKEMVVISQDEKGSNMAYINYRKPPKDAYECTVKSRGPKMVYTDTPANFKINLNNKNQVEISINLWNGVPIPMILVFQALGIVSDRQIAEYVINDLRDAKLAELLLHSFQQYMDKYGAHRVGGRQGRTQGAQAAEIPANGYDNRAQDETIEFWALYTIENIIKSKKKQKETERAMMVSEMRRRITEDLLPHLGDNNRKKAMFIGYYVKRLYRARLGLDREDDVYNYGNRRINTPGMLFGMVVDQTVRTYGKEFRKRLLTDVKENPNIKINDIAKMLEDYPITDKIENNINSTLRNGSWNLGSAYYKTSKSKISMMMDRKSRMDPLAMCRKVSTGVGKGNVSNKTRQLHQSIVRYLCLAETPEGGNIGLFKHYALSAYVTVNNPTETRKARELLVRLSGDSEFRTYSVDDVSSVDFGRYTKIFLNNDPCYVTEDPIRVRQEFVEARRRCDLTYTEVIYDYLRMEIRIWTDHGRIMTPIYIVDHDQAPGSRAHNTLRMNMEIMGRVTRGELSWYDLLAMKVIEYIGIHEQQFNCVVAMYPSELQKADPALKSYTHCEIHPSTWLGTSAGMVPFSVHNPSPRLVFQCAMGKQAMDIYNVNFHNRYDTFVHVMPLIERPLTTTYFADLVNYTKLPSGRNAIVAIMCYEGYNMEDSLMINKAFVDRWGFTSVNYKTINVDMSNARQQQIARPNPANTTGFKKTCSYDVIDKNGYPIIGKVVRKGDIVVGMVQRTAAKGKFEYIDKSVEYNEITPGVVDSILTSPVHNDHLFTKVRIRTKKGLVSGDKLCLSPDHQVLTTTGWVNVAELTTDHVVATLNQNGKLEYQNPTAIHTYDHDGDMILVESKQVNLLVTPNHKMYVAKRSQSWHAKKYQLIEAEQLVGRRIWYKKNAEWVVPDGEEPEVAVLPASHKAPEAEIPIEPWLMFYGLWIAEGCVDKYRVSVCVHKKRVRDVIIGALELMGIAHTYYQGGENVLIINDSRVAKLIMQDLTDIPKIKAIHKKLPEWVWSLNQRQCRILLQGLLLGDGSDILKGEFTSHDATEPTPAEAIAEYNKFVELSTRDRKVTSEDKIEVKSIGSWRYDTSSWKLKDDVMRLVLHCGWAANATVRHLAGRIAQIAGNRPCKTNATAWRLTINKGQVEPEINKPQKKGTQQLNQCRRVPYKGTVHCCTVPNGVFYVRRVTEDQEGVTQLPVWTGNSSFNGQKGTCGLVYPTEQFPFYDGGIISDDNKLTGGLCAGMVPDLIMNPHAFPSRMTIAQNIQGICNLLASITGVTIDGTAFMDGLDLEKIYQMLEKHGFNRHGNFRMRSGITGEVIPAMIFSTPVFYQRLKHIVDGKLYVRSIGARQRSTRQPLAGKNRGGGVRLGLMERDVLIAHGASLVIREKFLLNSDPYSLHVCQDCGKFAPGNPRERFYKCIRCRKSNRICQVVLPYATKRFIQEVITLNISMNLILG
jgi:DNA-directed RNA polymerase II subunit RPB2